ncbi:MAG: DUF2058 family protein [Pseudomonadota bacterium]
MAGSLRDQFLKAGVVDKKKARQSAHESRQGKKRKKKDGGAEKQVAPATTGAVERREKVARDRALNRQREAAAEARALSAQIDQLIEQHRVEKPFDTETDSVAFNVQLGDAVKQLHLTNARRGELTTGRVAIVSAGSDRFELVPGEVAARISERDASRVLYWHQSDDPGDADPDDPYADYKVPDDLVW